MIFVKGGHCDYWHRAQYRPRYVTTKGHYGESKHAGRVDGIKSQRSADGRFPHSTGTLTAAMLRQ